MKLLEMKNINKSFGQIQVLKNAKLTVEAGTVHALLGENGAGKSTMMNILSGVYPKDAGSIFFDGKTYDHMTIRQSEKSGIAFVHQELNLFNNLKVYENIFLSNEYTKRCGMLDRKRMRNEIQNLFDRIGISINPGEFVENLKTSEKQLLEIARALFFNAKLLILDEPTTALNNNEISNLFEIIEHLKREGTSFIFISHKMPEIFKISDEYTVLRNGEFICSGKIQDTNPERIASMMVGKKNYSKETYKSRKIGEVVLKLEHFTGKGFQDISLEVRKGQIVGLTGLQSAGSSELLQGIFGALSVTDGRMEVLGKTVRGNSIHESMKSGIAMLASNRKENSVIPDMNLLENMYLAEHSLSAYKFQIHKKKEIDKFEKYRKLLNIKAQSEKDNITSLSGGNQQKIFLARWLNTDADIILFDNPTQGIDVGAKTEIYQLILDLAEKGKTILINTLEVPELQKVADVCVVFYEGKIVKLLEHKNISEQTIMLYSTNATNEEKKESV